MYAKNPLQLASKWLQYLLIFFRATLVFSLLLLLLGPLFKWRQLNYLKPLLMVAVDNSESMLLHQDSAQIQQNLHAQIAAIRKSLAGDYDIQIVHFSDQITNSDSFNFKGKLTGFDALFDDAAMRYSNAQSGAMVVVSDGNYNTGTNPSYLASEFSFPVFTVGTGDTLAFKDCWIHHPKFNELVFEGNAFTIEFTAQSKGFNTVQTIAQLIENGKCIASKPVQLKGGKTQHCVFELQAQKEGIHTYQILLVPVNGERNVLNNQLQAVIEVVKSKQKIVLVYSVPHPDIAAIKQLFAANKNTELEVISLQKHTASMIQKADLYILYQLPGSKGEGLQLLQQLNAAQMPQLHFIGGNTSLAAWNKLQSGFEIVSGKNSVTEAKAWHINAEDLFVAATENELLAKLPPLLVPYGNYLTAPYAEVILAQQLGYVKTATPLLFFLRSHSLKKAFFCGEGLWHWRLLLYRESGNDEFLSTLLSKTIQYIAGKEDKSRFRVKPLKKLFDENEFVQFEATYFNELFEPDNSKKVQLVLTNTRNKQFKFEFDKTTKSYFLNAGLLAPGMYTYQCEMEGQAGLTRKGTIQIKEVLAERNQSGANHVLLKQMAATTNGQFIHYGNIAQLPSILNKQYPSKQVIAETDLVKEMIAFKFIFFLIFCFAVIEWAIRKWNGFI